MFAPSVRTRLAPSVFPHVGTASTLAAHDAAFLHGLNLRLHFGSRLGSVRALTGTIQAQILVPPGGLGAGEIEAFLGVLLLSCGETILASVRTALYVGSALNRGRWVEVSGRGGASARRIRTALILTLALLIAIPPHRTQRADFGTGRACVRRPKCHVVYWGAVLSPRSSDEAFHDTYRWCMQWRPAVTLLNAEILPVGIAGLVPRNQN